VVPAAIRRLLDETGPLRWNLVPGFTGELRERHYCDDTPPVRVRSPVSTSTPPTCPAKIAAGGPK
jgi:hypothetical protein